jgi:gamma-glutamylcyclotransferase (GGCT)/AIG2-like uncharacterized protein YtfP
MNSDQSLREYSNPNSDSLLKSKLGPDITSPVSKIFVYGILKSGFELSLSRYGGKLLGPARVAGTQLYHIGGGVGLRFAKDADTAAHGELWEIPDSLWHWLDQIEANGFAYTREEMTVSVDIEDGIKVKAWVYVHTYPGMAYERPIKGNKYRG